MTRTGKLKILQAGVLTGMVIATSGQTFINLDFEQATGGPIGDQVVYLPWETAAPGWSHSVGPASSIVLWNSAPLSAFQYYLLTGPTSPLYAPNTQLAGIYSLAFASGYQSLAEENPPWSHAFISQTGMIPAATRSLRMLARGPFQVLVGGETIPMYPLGENLHGGNISRFAGDIAELKIANTALIGHAEVMVDNVEFSSIPVSEEDSKIQFLGPTYLQHFPSLETGIPGYPYERLPVGWAMNAGRYNWISLTDGLYRSGVYCFSRNATSPEKSIGMVNAGTTPLYLGARLRNSTTFTFLSFRLSYLVKQWARGGTLPSGAMVPFEYSLSATSLTAGAYTGVASLGMYPIHTSSGPSFERLNGNELTNQRPVEASVSNISWAPGRTLWIRWVGLPDSAHYGHALALDAVSFSATAQPRIEIAPSPGGNVRITWSGYNLGYQLQASSSLDQPDWMNVNDLPLFDGFLASVEFAAAGNQRFFKLKKP